MAMTADDRRVLPSDDELTRLNVDKAREVATWLDSLGLATRAPDRSAISADLSDLYAAATRYQRLIDCLLTADVADRARVADQIDEVVSEIRHLDGHARSVARRLDRLSSRLDDDATSAST